MRRSGWGPRQRRRGLRASSSSSSSSSSSRATTGGYYDHFHHCCHHHHHYHHQPRQQRPMWDYPYGAWVRLKTKRDCPFGACALLWKAFGTLDYPRRRGTRPQKRWGMGETPNKRRGHRIPFDPSLGRSTTGLLYPKCLAGSLARLDWWWSCLRLQVKRLRKLVEDVGIHHHLPCSLF